MSTPDTPPPSRILSRENVLSLYLPAVVLSLGAGIAAPALPVFAKSFEISFGVATLILVFNSVGAAAATLPTGFMVDKVGRKFVLIAGPMLAAVASLLTAQAHSFPELLVYRFIAGWAQQMWMLARLAIIADTGAANQRGRQITGMISMESMGRLMGPAVGGFVAAATDIRVPFVLHAVISLLAIVPSFKLIKETAPSRTGRGRAAGAAGSVRELLIFPVLMLFVAQAFASITRGTLFQGGLNIYAVYAYDMTPQGLGIIATIASVIGIPITLTAGYLMDHFGRKASVVPGFALLSAALATLAFVDHLQAPVLGFVLMYFVVNAAQSMTSGNMQTIGSDVAPAHLRGRFFGIWQLIGAIAGVISPAVFGFLADRTGYGAGFIFLSVTAFAAFFVLATQVRTNMAERTRATEASA